MGEIRRTNPNTRYYSILGGELVKNSQEGAEKAEKRLVKNPKTGEVKDKWIIPVFALEGKIKSIFVKEDEVKGIKIKKLILRLMDNGDCFQIESAYDSSHAISLINRLANYAKKNLGSIPITIGSYKIQENDSERYNQGFWIHYNGGTKLESYYTKDNTPPEIKWKEITVNNKKMWDKTDHLRFFEKVLEGEVIPYFTNLKVEDEVIVESEPQNPEDVF